MIVNVCAINIHQVLLSSAAECFITPLSRFLPEPVICVRRWVGVGPLPWYRCCTSPAAHSSLSLSSSFHLRLTHVMHLLGLISVCLTLAWYDAVPETSAFWLRAVMRHNVSELLTFSFFSFALVSSCTADIQLITKLSSFWLHFPCCILMTAIRQTLHLGLWVHFVTTTITQLC